MAKSISQLLGKYDRLRDAGKDRRAEKVLGRINKKALNNPEQAADVGKSYAQDEFQQNINANRPDQNAIGGSQTYTTDPVTGKVTVNQTLDQGQQQLYDQQIGNVSAANTAFANAFASGLPYGQAYDFSGAPAAPSTQDLLGERSRIEQGLIDKNTGYLDQSYQKRRQQVMDEMAGRGNTPGSPAWDKALSDLDQNYNQELNQVRNDAISQAGQEFERSFNIGTQGRQNYINEMFAGRQQPLAELTTLQGMTGGPTTLPNFFQFQPIQYTGPNYADYLGMGIDAQLGRGALQNDRQKIALAGRGGGGGGDTPSFSIGGYPGNGVPVVPNAPNPAASGFAQGFTTGVGAA